MPVKLLYPSEEWEKIRQENIRQKGFKYCMETQVIKKDQGPIDVELSLCVLKSSKGKNTGSIGIIKDITDLKKTRDKLKESEEKYRTIFENSAVGIILTDENEHIISWNKFTEYLLGMDHKDLYLKSVESLYPSDEWKKIRSENIRKKGMKHHLETKMFTRNNDTIDVDLSVSVLKNHKGEIIGSIGIISDITKSKKIKDDLEKSEKRFKQLYDKAPIAYHTLSPEGLITNVNEKWCDIFNYRKEEVVGKSIFDFVIDNEREDAESSFERKIKSKESYSIPNNRTYLTKENEKRIFVINDFFSVDKNRNIVSIHTTMEDITELKRAKDKITSSEHKFRSIFENANDALFLISENKIVDCNTKAEEMFGCNRNYILKQKSFNLESGEKSDSTGLNNSTIIKKFKSALNGNPQFFEMKHKKIDGTIFDSGVSLSRIEIDEKIMLLAIVRDITLRKQMQEDLLKSKKKLSQIIQVSSIPTFIIDKNHIITHWNYACEKLTGLVADDMIGTTNQWRAFYSEKKPLLADLLVDKIAEKEILKIYNKCHKSDLIKEGYELEDFFYEAGSTGKWLFLTTTPLTDIDGNVTGAIETIQNVTKNKMVENELKDAHEVLQVTVKDLERKVIERTEDVEKLLQQKDEFIGQLGHDLKTPLSVLVNILPLIKDEIEKPEVKNHCDVAIRNIDYIQNLSIGILKIAEINSPHVKLDEYELNLKDFINKTIENKQIIYDIGKIEFENNIDDKIIVNGDLVRLSEVFDNIITNAIKYTDEGKCKIKFNAKKDKDFVTVSIKDNGIGMKKDELGNIFRDFYKIDTSRHDLNSAGLGLSICKHIIDLHGGRIWAVSEGKGRGTTINLTLKNGGKKLKK